MVMMRWAGGARVVHRTRRSKNLGLWVLMEGSVWGDGSVQLEREDSFIAGGAAVGFAPVEMVLHALYVIGTGIFVAVQAPGALLRVRLILEGCYVSR